MCSVASIPAPSGFVRNKSAPFHLFTPSPFHPFTREFLSACDRFAAPRVPSQMAHRRVLATARHTRVCLRVAVLRRWPHLRAVARRVSPNRSRMSPLAVFVAAFGFSVSLPFAAPSLPAIARSGGRGASSRNTASRSASRRLRAIAEPSRRVSFSSTLVVSLRSSAGFLSAPCLRPPSLVLCPCTPPFHLFTLSPRHPRQHKAGNPPAASGDIRACADTSAEWVRRGGREVGPGT